MARFYILRGRVAVAVDDYRTWSTFMGLGLAARIVAQDTVPPYYEVSTVFVGVGGDEGPFETKVFGRHDELGAYGQRYRTWGEAEAGHAATVAYLRTHRFA